MPTVNQNISCVKTCVFERNLDMGKSARATEHGNNGARLAYAY